MSETLRAAAFKAGTVVGAGPFVPELDRILALPSRPLVDCERERRPGGGLGHYPAASAALAEFMTERLARHNQSCACSEFGYTCIRMLNPAQAWVLYELPRAGGIHGFISVGAGKTNMGILAPLVLSGCRNAVLLAEPSQRLHYRNFYLRLREHFRVPSIVFDDGTSGYVSAGAPVLHFIPYSKLSRPDSTDLLERLAPDLVIADEAHRVSNISSRTRRLMRLFTKYPNTKFCDWSGTLMKKSIRDQAHLAAYALGTGSPIPIDPDQVEAWSQVIDPSPTPDRQSSTARSLFKAFTGEEPAENPFLGNIDTTGLRKGFQKRLIETLGVISTKTSSIGASIYIRERAAPKIPDAVRKALTDVRERSMRPDEEELVEAVEIARCAREVASGFFYRWVFPKGEPAELIGEWFAKRKSYCKELRNKLLLAELHLDSPLLCYNAAARAWAEEKYVGELPIWFSETWPEWAAIKDRVYHESRSKWIDDYLAADAAAWAKEHRGIVWYQSNAFGRRVAELAGLPCHGGGADAEKNILAEDGSRSIVASIKAHGSGRDSLQTKFNEQLVCEIPSSGDIWEQLIGRTHRDGQTADSVEFWLSMHVSENRDALRRAISQAEFAEATTGNRQKILSADLEFDL